MPVIRIPAVLRAFTAFAADVAVDATTVRAALAALDAQHPGIGARLLDARGVKPYVRIYVGADDIGALAGLDTPVGANDEISIIPAIAGGAGELGDDQLARYARHVQLDGIGRAGQAAVLAAAARVDATDRAAELAAMYLAAGGAGTVIVPTALVSAELTARGPDTRVVATVPRSADAAPSTGHAAPVAIDATPSWWPASAGDGEALAFWRGGLAAARWLAEAAKR